MRTGEFTTKARPRGRFAVATKALPRRVIHLVVRTEAVWYRLTWRSPASFKRMSATMACDRWLSSVTIHLQPPTEFELCNYCLMAKLGIEPTEGAPKTLARVSLEELEQVERSLGIPVSRAVRLARVAVVAS